MDSEDEVKKASINSRNIDPEILSLFWQAVESDSTKRLNAVADIICILIRHEAESKKGPSDSLKYCLERCIKGLPSTRKCARYGFTVLLTEILKKFPVLELDLVLTLLGEHLAFDGSKGEKGSVAVARSLALGAVVRSHRLPTEISNASKIIKELITLSAQKCYVILANCVLLKDLLRQLSKVSFSEILPAFEDELKQGFESGSPENLWLALLCQEVYKKQTYVFMEEYWGSKHIIIKDKKCNQLIGPILKKTTSVHPKMHPLVECLISHCEKHKMLGGLWKEVIESTLLEMSFEGTYLAFEIFQLILPKMTDVKDIESVLSGKLLESIIKSLKGKSHPLRFAAEKLLHSLTDFLKDSKDSEVQFQIIKSCINPPSSILFDSLTKTQFLANSIQNLNPEAAIKFGEFMIGIVANPGEVDENMKNSYRCSAAKQLGLLIGHLNSQEWKLNILLFLFFCGFLKEIKKNHLLPMLNKKTLTLCPSVREACRQNFLRGLELLMRPQNREGYKLRLAHACQSLIPLAEKINEALNSSDEISTRDLNMVKSHWDSMFTLVKKFKKCDKIDQKEDESHMFQVLLINFSIMLFFADVHIQDLSVLEELQECAKRALKQRRKSLKPEGPAWIEVLTDIFLSLLSDGSPFLRKSIDCTFPLFCPFLTEQALQQLLDVFKFSKADDVLVPEVMESSDEDEVEFESPSISDSDNEDSDTGEKMGHMEELRTKLRKALGPAASINDSEEEQYLSDSDMFRLDSAISDAFKDHVKNPKTNQVKDQSLLNFRMRCLELLSKYIKLSPPVKRVLQCVEPLLNIFEHGMRSKNQRALADKASSLLELLLSFSKTFKHQSNDTETISVEDMELLLTNILGKIQKTAEIQQSSFLSRTCIFMIRCFNKISSVESTSEMWYLPLFEKLLRNYLCQSSSQINPQIFHKLLQIFPEFGPAFLPILIELSFDDDVRLFKKTQAFMLLTASAKASTISTSLDSKKWCNISLSLVPKVTMALEKLLTEDLKMSHTFQMLTALETVLNATTKQGLKENVQAQSLPKLKDVLTRISSTKFGKKYRKTINSLFRLTNCSVTENKDTVTETERIQQKKEKKNLKRRRKQEKKEKLKIQKTEQAAPVNGDSEMDSEVTSVVHRNEMTIPNINSRKVWSDETDV